MASHTNEKEHAMTRIDSTMIAEIGTWQDFPPQSGLRRTLTTWPGITARGFRAAASAARWPSSTTTCCAISA